METNAAGTDDCTMALSDGRLFRSASTIMVGTVAGQAIAFFALPLLSRLYSPRAFGLLALFLVATTFLSIVANLRYTLTILMAKTDEEAATAVALVSVISLITASIVALILLLFGRSLPVLLGLADRLAILWILPPLSLAIGCSPAVLFWWLRRHAFHKNAAYQALLSMLTAGAQCALALASGRLQEFGLVFGYAGAQILLASIGFAYLLMTDWARYRQMWSLPLLWRFAHDHRRFPLYSLPAILIEQLYMQIIPILLGTWYSTAIVGKYYMALKVSSNPFAVVSGALGQAFLPAMSRASPDLRPLEPLISRFLVYLGVLGAPVVAIVALHAEMIFRGLLGPRWSGIGAYAVPLVIAFSFLASMGWLSRIYDVLHRQRLNLIVTIGMNVLILASAFAGKAWGKDPVWALVGVAFGLIVSHAVWIAITARIAGFRDRVLLHPAGVVAMCAAGFVAADFILSLFLRGWAEVLALLPILAVYYAIATVRIFRLPEWSGFRALMGRRKGTPA